MNFCTLSQVSLVVNNYRKLNKFSFIIQILTKRVTLVAYNEMLGEYDFKICDLMLFVKIIECRQFYKNIFSTLSFYCCA